MTNIYFISEKTLREESLINDNVDSSFILSAIRTAQDINLQEVIGTALFNSLKDQVVTGTFKSPYYERLMDEFIQPYLVNQIMSAIVIPIHYKFRNAGIVTNNDQHFQSSQLKDVEYVKTHYEHLAVFNANRIVEFLINNKEQFDEIQDCGCDNNWLKLNKKTNKCSLFLK